MRMEMTAYNSIIIPNWARGDCRRRVYTYITKEHGCRRRVWLSRGAKSLYPGGVGTRWYMHSSQSTRFSVTVVCQ